MKTFIAENRFARIVGRALSLSTIMMICAVAVAQDEAPDAPSKEEKPAGPSGDAIHLKSGTIMRGVQVLRSTPKYYEVQIVEGVEPLQIPRRQVESVDYDDIDILRLRREAALMSDDDEVTIAPGERVASSLRDKLMAPIAAEVIVYTNRDLVEILNETRTRLALNLEIDPSIEEVSPLKRRWTVEIPPERTLMAFLREDMSAQFEFIEAIFEGDHIVVLTKKAAQERAQAASEQH